jgi:hypothetical protein
MYCSIDDVKRYDHEGITENISDENIEEHIVMATEQVDFYTNNSFDVHKLPLSVIKATALITLILLEKDTQADNRVITSEKIDVFSATYSEKTMPKQSERLLNPYVKGNTYIGGA